MNEDTIQLLKECDSGTKTAAASIRQVLSSVKSEQLMKILTDSLKKHEKIGNELHDELSELSQDGKEPNPMAKISSWVKINLTLLGDNSDAAIASLITDGCAMGTKQLGIYKNKYPLADSRATKLAERLIDEETALADSLRAYL